MGARRRRHNLRSHRWAAFRFFREHAGYVVGERALCAMRLARAEERLERITEQGGARIVWDFDDFADLSWMDAEELKREHEVLACRVEFRCASCRGWQTVAALCGIVDASNDYRRVIEAELAAEALLDAFGHAKRSRMLRTESEASK